MTRVIRMDEHTGSGTLRQVDIHPSGRIQQTDIPEDPVDE